METTSLNKISLITELQQFTGTEYYYNHQVGNLKMFLTDGTKYLAEKAQCYWLMDLILSYQYKSLMEIESFQVWKLKKQADRSWIITCTDGNDKALAEQVIQFSDFPLPEISIWLVDSVAMLPSEY